MTRLDPQGILSLVHNLWDDEDDQVMALAIALATSKGNPYWQSGGIRPGEPVRVGLWGIPAGIYPWASYGALTSPETNAMAAHSLWAEHGGGWAWTPAADSPAIPGGLAWARAVAQQGPGKTVHAARPELHPPADLPAAHARLVGRTRHAGHQIRRIFTR